MPDNRLKTRLQRLEKEAEGRLTRATLKDGREVLIGGTDRFDAVVASLKGDLHRLHDPLRRLAPVQADPSLHDLSSILRALEGGAPDEG